MTGLTSSGKESDGMATSRTCASASPRPRRRRRSPRPCRWSRPPSCAARRRRPKPRGPMPSAWKRCSATSPRAWPASDSAPKLLAGTGSDQVHLLLVCTGERGLCGAFNSSIVRLAREHANRCSGRGQRGQDPLRRPQGLRAASPQLREANHRPRRAARRAHARLRQRRRHRREGASRCIEHGEFDVARCSIRASSR